MPCVIPYCPRPLQWRFHEERTRFCVLLCHRRFGKTVAAVNDLIREALRRGGEDWRAAYAAPFLVHVEDNALSGLFYHAHGFMELCSAIATLAAEYVSGDARGMYTH